MRRAVLKSRSLSARRRLKAMKAAKERFATVQDYAEGNDPTTTGLLENALSTLIQSQNDPRPRLEVLRMLPQASFFCLACPSGGPHDPLNIKPQPFVFDRSIAAVPIFTSFRFVETFARRFRFKVRGPDDAEWVDGTREHMELDASMKEDNESQFHLKTCEPVFVFGPPQKPHLVGCYGECDAVLQQIEILPQNVDVIVNASSHLHWVMKRKMVQKLQTETVVDAQLYHEIAHCVIAEFSRFFINFAPEVRFASYVVMPVEMVQNSEGGTEGHSHHIHFLISSDDFTTTLQNIQRARGSGMIAGHSTLFILSYDRAPEQSAQVSTVFYSRDVAEEPSNDLEVAVPTEYEGAFAVHRKTSTIDLDDLVATDEKTAPR